jgi:hypothetical protein
MAGYSFGHSTDVPKTESFAQSKELAAVYYYNLEPPIKQNSFALKHTLSA